MRTLGIVALVLAVAGFGIALFGNVETFPNWESTHQAWSEPGGSSDRILDELRTEYMDTLGLQALGALGLAVVSLILGIVSVAKKGGKLGAIAIVLALVTAALALRLTQGM
jgi:hypothetical protein